MLADCRVLIAEDETIIALDLAHAVQKAQGEVVGPFATLIDGMTWLARGHVEAAILDVHLFDRDVEPMALELLSRGIPVVFHTASDIPAEIVRRHGPMPLCPKPMDSDRVVSHLARVMGRTGPILNPVPN